jgi:hypothetical protein
LKAEVAVMTEETLFAELIKDLDPFDRKLLFALDELRTKQGTMTINTSRFEVCRLLRLEFNPDNVRKLDEALERLVNTPLYLPGELDGFAVATKTIAQCHQERDSEKLVISLGKLFTL